MSVKSIESVRPFSMRPAQPVVDGKKPFELEARGTPLTIAAADNQTGVLENAQMLGDRRLAQRRPAGEFKNARLARPKALENGSPCGIGKGGKCSVQGFFGRHYL